MTEKLVLISVAMDSLSSVKFIFPFVKLNLSVPLHLFCVCRPVFSLWEAVCLCLCVVDQSDS